MKVTERVWLFPRPRTVPAAGVYMKVPGIVVVASSCVPESGVPRVMSAGLAQVMTGVAWVTLIVVNAVVGV